MNVKHILILTASVSAAVANAFTYTSYPYPEPEMLTAVSNITSQSEAVNTVKEFVLAKRNQYSSLHYTPGFEKFTDAEYAEIDRVFGNIGWATDNARLPICFTNLVENLVCKIYPIPENKAALFKSLCYKYKNGMVEGILNNTDFEETTELFDVVYYSNRPFAYKQWKSAMQRGYLKKVKKYLRANNVSFVTKSGVNPVEPYMVSFVDALNAPGLHGLREAYEAVGLTFTIDLSILMSEEEAESTANKILDGDTEISHTLKYRLLFALGVDGYNNFVKAYNGD